MFFSVFGVAVGIILGLCTYRLKRIEHKATMAKTKADTENGEKKEGDFDDNTIHTRGEVEVAKTPGADSSQGINPEDLAMA